MQKSKNILGGTMEASVPEMKATASDVKDGYSASASAVEVIRPFHVNVPEEKLVDLKRRILAMQWPEKETANNLSTGLQLAGIKALAAYWATCYDWRKMEARLNALPQFITEINGIDIHFIHVKSKYKNALPIIVTHGWPGSFIEQLKIIGPLTDPIAYGGKAEDAFDVVIPSIPGYGYSGKPEAAGWDPARVAATWPLLMKRIGYNKFVAQGGDWGAIITEQMAVLAPPELLAIHTNLPSAVPTEIFTAIINHTSPCGLSAEEANAFKQLNNFFANGLSYALQMAAHPLTMLAIADSPVGLATWFLDNALWSPELIINIPAGKSESPTRDEVLDCITMTWLTNTAVSEALFYRENKLSFFVPMGIKIPVAVSAFPNDVYQAPRSWVERAYPQLIHYNKPEKGGHFAAWEQPAFFMEEIRAAFRFFRR